MKREKRHMIETMMKKKHINEKKVKKYFKEIEEKTAYHEEVIKNLKFKTEEKYKQEKSNLQTTEFVSIIHIHT